MEKFYELFGGHAVTDEVLKLFDQSEAGEDYSENLGESELFISVFGRSDRNRQPIYHVGTIKMRYLDSSMLYCPLNNLNIGFIIERPW